MRSARSARRGFGASDVARLPRRPVAGLLLAMMGAAALGAIVLLADNPVDLESYLQERGTAPVGLFVARGPAAGEYDAMNDTTLVVFACSHGACDVALRVEGDVTGKLGRRHFLVEPVDDAATFEREPLADGVTTEGVGQGLVAPSQEVTNATANRYTIHSPWPRALLTGVSLLAVALGAILYADVGAARAWLASMATLGVALGHLLALGGPILRILASYVLLPALGIGILLSLWRRTRAGGLGLALLAGLALLVALALAAYFPAGPEV